MDADRNVFKSSDYYLCSYLLAVDSDMKVVGIEGSHPRCTFILTDPDPEAREEFTHRYLFEDEDYVSASRLFSKQKLLQRLLRDCR
jgi:proteasome lid subunit RPN8/RPN11